MLEGNTESIESLVDEEIDGAGTGPDVVRSKDTLVQRLVNVYATEISRGTNRAYRPFRATKFSSRLVDTKMLELGARTRAGGRSWSRSGARCGAAAAGLTCCRGCRGKW